MKPYECYKETSTPWVERIPSHWNLDRVGSLFSERKMRVSDKEYPPLSVTKSGILPQLATAAKSNDRDNRKMVVKGDFVINSRSDRKGSSGISPYTGSVSLINIVLEPKQDNNSGYMHHLLKSISFVEEYYRNGKGIVGDLWTTRYSEMKTIMLPIPPICEQNQIMRFLDWKLFNINKLIKAKKKLISLLNEQKQAIINKAVKKGIDDTVIMKDSGVEWIGEIPQGWEVCRCKYLFSERNIRSENGAEVHLSMSQKLGLIPDELLQERRMLSENYIGGKLCLVNDLVLNRLKAHLGVFALASCDGVVSPDYTVLKIQTDKILPRYAGYVLRCNDCRKELRVRVRGIVEGFWRLYTEDFNNIILPLPSIGDQIKILEFIEQIDTSIEKVKGAIEKEIDLLTEYRTSLMSSVVTGQIDVRDVIIPNFEVEQEVLEDETEVFCDEVEA